MDSYRLEHFIEDMEDFLAKQPDLSQIMAEGKQYVQSLLTNSAILDDILTSLVLDDAFLQAQYQAIDPNDIIIYRSPQRTFSLRAYIWEPGVRYPIHDHGSWGIVGAYLNPVRERKYTRLDHGQDANSVRLEVKSDEILPPGQITTVLPIDDGIHQMENPGDRVAVSLHVYGKAIRKGYIQYYDPHFNTVRRVYPPNNYTRALAIRTLGAIAQPWAKKVLQQGTQSNLPEYMKAECHDALLR